MRVLLAHNRYRTSGGEERHVDLLAEWLPRVGVEVARLEVESPNDASPAERMRLGLTLAYRPEGAALVRQAIAREKPDVVHFHNLMPLLTTAALHEAHRQGCRVVLTCHNYRFACPAGTLLRQGKIHDDCIDGSSLLCGLRNPRDSWSESVAYGIALEAQRRLRLPHRWVDAYIAPSAFMASMLARAGYPRSRIHVIRHGTPLDDTFSPAGDFALYAGRLSAEKGIETLLAASRLAPRVPLVIAGDGPFAARTVAAANGAVSYIGRVDSEAVAELMRNARFTVAPSQCFEGQPFSVVESMAHGRAVIASRIGGLAEIIDDGSTGVLVPPEYPSALAAAMESLWDSKESATAIGERAWHYAREHFSPIAQAGCVSALYGRLVASRASLAPDTS